MKRLALFSVVLALSISAVCFTGVGRAAASDQFVMDYTETADKLNNPERGFYKAMSARLLRSGGELFDEFDISEYGDSYGILHLRIGLEDFSANAGGIDSDITAAAKQSLIRSFDALRAYKVGAIVRFSYNVDGEQDGEGYKENEPAFSRVLGHVSSLSKIISDYTDVILGVESGMLGPWGEQHSTTLASPSKSNASTYHSLVKAWLDGTPECLGITVRRPLYFVYWANEEFDESYSVSNVKDIDFEEYPLAKRVGVYNDGYLGSSSDLGTFTDRNNEVEFLAKAGTRTFYGGEVVADSETDGIGDYNNCDYIEKEAFITHTSYLNIDWNYNAVISRWQQNEYGGEDPLYEGMTEFEYVENHLGYRFVLTSSSLAVTQETIDGSFTVKNVGFGNLIRRASAQLVMTRAGKSYELPITADFTDISSRGEQTFTFAEKLPDEISTGKWSIYLNVISCSGKSVRFANVSSNYTENGNLLGWVDVEKQVTRQSYLVVFDGYYGTLVSGNTSQVVKKGEDAVPPVFKRDGYRFVGWSESVENVNADLSVYAVWEKVEVNVGMDVGSDSSGADYISCSASALPIAGSGALLLLFALALALKRK